MNVKTGFSCTRRSAVRGISLSLALSLSLSLCRSSSASDRRMRPFQVLSKLKLHSFIRSESFAMNVKNGFLARDTPPSVDSFIECAR